VLLAALVAGGVVRVRGFEWSAVHLAAAVPVMLPAVLAEELWARLGLVSGLTLALRRGVVAAVVAAIVIGGVQLWWTPGATIFTAASAAAGALVGGVAYARTGRLWMPVALSLAWRLAEGPMFGLEGHGTALSQAWIQRDLVSFSAWSGGVHGIDTGLWAIGVKLVLAAAVFLVTAGRKDAA
jgi:membrane protease YdiL (CAAX protease family)